MPNNRPIGFFDSGVGGISVLKEGIKLLPNENFVYFGDSKNAPYGTKSHKEVKELTIKAIEFLLSKDVKSIVIACNTATSVAVEEVREKYKNVPIIGIEPALKPAVELYSNGKIVIMATPMTLSENKFNRLIYTYGKEAKIIPLPCEGLVELIENGNLEGEEVDSYFHNKFKDINREEISCIVLGCTHYPFIKESLKKFVGRDVAIIDGSIGTARHLKSKLAELDLINHSNNEGTVTIYNSAENNDRLIELCYKLIKY